MTCIVVCFVSAHISCAVLLCVCQRGRERGECVCVWCVFMAYMFTVVFLSRGCRRVIACAGLLWLHDYDRKEEKKNKSQVCRAARCPRSSKTFQPPATDNSNNRGKFPLTHDFIRLWTDCFLSSASRNCVCCSSSVCFEGFPFLAVGKLS